MTDGKLMGMGVDLSPNYYKYLEPYRILHPNSSFGLPGRSNTNTKTSGRIISFTPKPTIISKHITIYHNDFKLKN